MLWSKDILEVNPDCQVTVEQVGSGKHKVVLADNVFLHPQQVGQLALNLYYHENQSLVGSYPGSRAVITLDTAPLIGHLSKLWGEPLVPFHTNYHPVIFSAISNRDYTLSTWQRQPHIDQGVTAMMYLNPEGMYSGGTGLYRHRPTGLERLPIAVNAEVTTLAEQQGMNAAALKREDGYAEFMNTVMFKPEYAMRDNVYINDGNEFWELLYLIEMRPNRLVIFDGRMPHSQHIQPDQFREYYRINQVMYFKGHD
ncbi:MAG: DUF6445 family protein [Acidobacteriota bacterium]